MDDIVERLDAEAAQFKASKWPRLLFEEAAA
jgi:hypothetical protein